MEVRVLSPTLGSPVWGSGIRRRSPQSIWLWRPAGLNCRSSTGVGETETPQWEDAHKFSCAPGPRAKLVTSKEPGPDLPSGLQGSPMEGGCSCGSLLGHKGGWWTYPGLLIWRLTSCLGHLHQYLPSPKSLQAPVLGCIRPKNQKGRNTVPLINRQAT